MEFATKPQLARRMIERAVAAKMPFAWITGDEVYGDDRHLRVWLEQEDLHFVLAVASNQYVWPDMQGQSTVSELVEATPQLQWQRLSAGAGAKGPRWYAWVSIPLLSWRMPGERSLLLRRSLSDGKLAYYVCYAPRGTPLDALVRVAGMRWTIEECFEAAKGEVGLDQYEVRTWHGWYRHITLSMFAHAFLAVLHANAIDPSGIKKKASQPDDEAVESAAATTYIALTVSEIRKSLWQLAWACAPCFTAVIQWSLWRRRHQAVARACHYLRRARGTELQLLY